MPSYIVMQGDRDCSSSIISAYQAVGVKIDSNCADIKTAFLNTKLFQLDDIEDNHHIGDICVSENHVVMCVEENPCKLAEFAEEGKKIIPCFKEEWLYTIHCNDDFIANQASQIMKHLCECGLHKYSVVNRWGNPSTEMVITKDVPAKPEPAEEVSEIKEKAGNGWTRNRKKK